MTKPMYLCIILIMPMMAGCPEDRSHSNQAENSELAAFIELLGEEYHAPSADIVAKFQGEWIFNKERFIEEADNQLQTEEEKEQFKQEMALYAVLEKENNFPIHPDILLLDAAIIGSGWIQPEYNIFNLKENNGRVTGRALYHEDRHDPGDAFIGGITLYVENNELFLIFSDEQSSITYIFNRNK